MGLNVYRRPPVDHRMKESGYAFRISFLGYLLIQRTLRTLCAPARVERFDRKPL